MNIDPYFKIVAVIIEIYWICLIFLIIRFIKIKKRKEESVLNLFFNFKESENFWSEIINPSFKEKMYIIYIIQFRIVTLLFLIAGLIWVLS